MTIRKVGLISLLGLASLGGALLVGMPTSTATARPVYVQLQPYRGRLAVYHQLPTSTSSLQNGTDVPASKSQVYRSMQTGKYLTFKYMRIQTLAGQSLGWINRQDIKMLTHVTKGGLLTQYKVKKLAGRLTTTKPTKKITVTVQGPTATAVKLTTKKVTAKTLTGKSYQVVKQSTTDFGRYYQVQKNHQNYGWVPVTGFKVTSVKKATKTAISKTDLKQINALVTANHLQGTLLMTTAKSTQPTVKAYGQANVATAAKNSANTVYPIASLQKAMTGTMIEQLIQAGQLSLQTPLSHFYPNVKGARSITVQQLLTHTSGIRMSEVRPSKSLSEAAAVKWTLAHMVVTPQRTWNYTSANFTLLAGIVTKVTGKSYATNLRQRILKPAKLMQTHNWNKLPAETVATPYAYTTRDYGKKYRVSKPLLSSELGAGNLSMTVGDYYKFSQAFNNGKLLTTAGHQNLTSTTINTYAGGFYYSPIGTQHATGYDNHISNFYTRTKNGQVTVIGFWNQADHVTARSVMDQIVTILNK